MSVARRATPVSQIPGFKSYEDEAEFWDSHSPEDFPDEFEDVEVQIRRGFKDELNMAERRRLISMLSHLSSDERQAVALVLLGLAESEIATILGWDSKQSAQTMRRARRRISSFPVSR